MKLPNLLPIFDIKYYPTYRISFAQKNLFSHNDALLKKKGTRDFQSS